MKWELHRNSLFAILLRQPWWVSVMVAAAVFGVLRIWLDWGFAAFAAAPFVVIAGIAGWRELRTPSGKRTAAILERLRALSWEAFAGELETAWRREGYTVSRVEGKAIDFRLLRDSRVTLVACKRWKAVRTGVEPLREFKAATGGEASECLYFAVGEVTDTARAFATETNIRLAQGDDLARLIGR